MMDETVCRPYRNETTNLMPSLRNVHHFPVSQHLHADNINRFAGEAPGESPGRIVQFSQLSEIIVSGFADSEHCNQCPVCSRRFPGNGNGYRFGPHAVDGQRQFNHDPDSGQLDCCQFCRLPWTNFDFCV